VPLVTDPDSAKMKTSHGVIQGYTAVAAVDGRHQVIVHGAAHGEGQEHGLLKPAVDGLRAHLAALDASDVLQKARLTADAGYASENNMKYVFEQGIDPYIADSGFRSRDPRFANADRYKVRHREERRQDRGRQPCFRPTDFTFNELAHTCICPAGKHLYKNGANVTIQGFTGMKFTAPKSACWPCALRDQCPKHPAKTNVRQVVFFNRRTRGAGETFTAKMKRKIDSVLGKRIYQRRLATVEPVFANLRAAKRLDRFTPSRLLKNEFFSNLRCGRGIDRHFSITQVFEKWSAPRTCAAAQRAEKGQDGLFQQPVRGKPKVNGQWLLYCLVHYFGKIQRYGPLPAPSG